MSLANPFGLLSGFDHDDPFLLIAAKPKKAAAAAPHRAKKALTPAKRPAKLPSKRLPPAQAVKESKGVVKRGGGGDRGSERRRGGFDDRDSYGDTENDLLEQGFHRRFGISEDGETEKPSDGEWVYGNAPRDSYRGGSGFGRRGVLGKEPEEGDPPLRRQFDRHSIIGRGNELKRDGYGRGNWGTLIDQGQKKKPEGFSNVVDNYSLLEEKSDGEEDGVTIDWKENGLNETELEEPEDKEMTLDEYEKLLEEKKKILRLILCPGGHGGGVTIGGVGGINVTMHAAAPSIEDAGQFPTLCAK